MELGIKATVDVVFKKVFGSREHSRVALSFLNALLAEIGRPMARSIDILDPYETGRFFANKDTILDIKAEDETGRTFQVEMQVRAYPTLRRRMLGNWASLYSSQLAKGQEDGEHLPVISIWLVASGFFPESTWIESWVSRGERMAEVLHEDLLIVAVDLARWRSLRESSQKDILESGIDRWLYLITESEHIDPDFPPGAITGPEYEEAIEIMAVFTKEDVERDRYFNRIEYQRMMADMKRDFREEGLAEGREAGREEGREEGRRIQAREDARRLKARGVDLEIILEATGLARDEIEEV